MNLGSLCSVPNLISLLRIVLIPLFLYFIFTPIPAYRILALVVFAAASITDFFDGWMARRLKQESEMGKFLDPLADKFLVVSGLIAFLILDPLIPFWMIVVIVGRDILITFMRYLAIKKGHTLRTSRFGKVKTAFQMVSIIVIIMVFVVRKSGVYLEIKDDVFSMYHVFEIITDSTDPEKWLIIAPYCLMALVTLLTALSGIRYLITNWRLFLPPYSEKNKSVS